MPQLSADYMQNYIFISLKLLVSHKVAWGSFYRSEPFKELRAKKEPFLGVPMLDGTLQLLF